MLLSDLGAEVVRVDRTEHVRLGTNVAGFVSPHAVLDRGRRSVGVDLRHPDGAATVLRLCELADVLVEGMRPGVVERLGVGPADVTARNPRLVYARMTGWGQDGPLAHEVGHDLNYVALAGVLAHIGPEDGAPTIPLNLLADFGGGGMLVVLGIVAALFERERSGTGQVIDAAMVDGSAQLMSIFVGLDALGTWGPRGTNLLDGGAHFYNVYECADGEWISIASYEPKFYAELLDALGFDDLDAAAQMDTSQWPALKERFAAHFHTRPRHAWLELFAGRDICVAPVLTMSAARAHPHNVARATFTEVDGAPHPSPAPRFSRTPSAVQRAPVAAGADTHATLADWGFADAEIAALEASGAIAQA
jgi:alpha-methylacyl-CoA racemase